MSATIAGTVAEVLNKPRTTAEASLKAPLADVVGFGPFAFDRVNGLLSRHGVELSLPPRAIAVLALLIDRAGDVVPKAELLEHVWKDTFVTEVSLTEAISLLRQTLADDPQRPAYIQTQPRRGYRFVAPLTDGAAPGAESVSAESPGLKPRGHASVKTRGHTSSKAREDAVRGDAPLTAGGDDQPADEVWPAWLPWVVSGVMLLALVAVSAGLLGQPGLRERPVARFTLDPGEGVEIVADAGPGLAISRDGARIAFVGRRGNPGPTLFVRELARLDAAPVPGTEGARAPFFSPDGRWLGFFARGRLFKVALAGGAPVALCEAPEANGAVWTQARTIVFAGRTSGGLRRVSEDGGRDEILTTPDAATGEVRHVWPSLAASERSVLFTALPADGAPESARVAAVSLDTGDVRPLVEGATFGRALDSGHLLFVRERRVQAAPFDAEALVIQGAPVTVLETVAVDGAGIAQLAIAASGALAQLTTAARDNRRGVAWRWGSAPPTIAPPFDVRAMRAMSAAPDGAYGAAAVSDGHRADIWVWHLNGTGDATGEPVRLTSEGQNTHPVWTPDGRTVVYGARIDERFELAARPADGGSSAVRLAVADRSLVPTSVSADGQLLYTRTDAATGMDVWRLMLQHTDGRIATSANPQPLIAGRGDQREAAYSPDGRWLAWQSNASGSWRVVVRNVRGSAVDHDLGPSLGGPLFWAEGQLAFQTEETAAAVIRLGPDAILDRSRVPGAVQIGGLVPARGGLLWRAAESPVPGRLEVVLEWTKELSAKVPVRPKDVKAVR